MAKKQAATTTQTATPAEPVNKSKAIRGYLAAHPNARNSEVAAALTKAGIPVSPNFVATVKTKPRPAAEAAAPKQETAVQEKAKSADGSKKQAVLAYMKAHPDAERAEIVKGLADQGIHVNPTYVSIVKARKAKRRQVVEAVVDQRGIGVSDIKAALECLKVCGTVGAAKEALAAAADIKKMVAVATAAAAEE
jgi:hypothetical protein